IARKSRVVAGFRLTTAGMTIIRIALLSFALCHLPCRNAHAISITAGPTLTGNPVSSETNALTNGVTVQLTVDTAGQVQINFFQVSPVDSSLTQVASIAKNVSGGVSTGI